MTISIWWVLLYLFWAWLIGYGMGRGAEIQAGINERRRRAKAYGGNPWDY